jgi:hypothetical protein
VTTSGAGDAGGPRFALNDATLWPGALGPGERRSGRASAVQESKRRKHEIFGQNYGAIRVADAEPVNSMVFVPVARS